MSEWIDMSNHCPSTSAASQQGFMNPGPGYPVHMRQELPAGAIRQFRPNQMRPMRAYSMMSQPPYHVPYGQRHVAPSQTPPNSQSQLMSMLVSSPSPSQPVQGVQQIYRSQPSINSMTRVSQKMVSGPIQSSLPQRQTPPNFNQNMYMQQQQQPPQQQLIVHNQQTTQPNRYQQEQFNGQQRIVNRAPPMRAYTVMSQPSYTVPYGQRQIATAPPNNQSQLANMLGSSPSPSQPVQGVQQQTYRSQPLSQQSRPQKMGPNSLQSSLPQHQTPPNFHQSPYGPQHSSPPPQQPSTPQQPIQSPRFQQEQFNGQSKMVNRVQTSPIKTIPPKTTFKSKSGKKVVEKVMPVRTEVDETLKVNPFLQRVNPVVSEDVLRSVGGTVDPQMVLEDNVRAGVMMYMESLVDDLVKETVKAANLRKSKQIKNKDVDFVLRKFGISAPGTSSASSLVPSKKSNSEGRSVNK